MGSATSDGGRVRSAAGLEAADPLARASMVRKDDCADGYPAEPGDVPTGHADDGVCEGVA